MSVKKGDPVRVRLYTGEVADAVYEEPSALEKCHYVKIGETFYLALGGKHERKAARWWIPFGYACRFVGPTPTINLSNRGEK